MFCMPDLRSTMAPAIVAPDLPLYWVFLTVATYLYHRGPLTCGERATITRHTFMLTFSRPATLRLTFIEFLPLLQLPACKQLR